MSQLIEATDMVEVKFYDKRKWTMNCSFTVRRLYKIWIWYELDQVSRSGDAEMSKFSNAGENKQKDDHIVFKSRGGAHKTWGT